MRTVVCVKQILDPELPPREFAIDPERKDAARGGAPLVIGPFDLNAVEVAVQVKERGAGPVTVLTAGGPEAREALKRALAMGCDDAVHVTDLVGADPGQAARVLAAAIKRIGDVGLVLCGRQSGDWDSGQVGPRLAEELQVPLLALVARVEPHGTTVRACQEVASGTQIVEADLPAVATVTNAETNQPRMPKVKDTMMANRKPVQQWTVAELGLPEAALGTAGHELEVLDLTIPHTERACEFVAGETGADKGRALARRLRELKVI